MPESEDWVDAETRVVTWADEPKSGERLPPGSMPPGVRLWRTSHPVNPDDPGAPDTDTDSCWSLELQLPEAWLSFDAWNPDIKTVVDHASSMVIHEITHPFPTPGHAAAVLAAVLVMHEVAEFHGGLWAPHSDPAEFPQMVADLTRLVNTWKDRWPAP